VAYVVLRTAEGVGDLQSAQSVEESAARIGRALEQGLVRTKRPVALHVVQDLPTGATGKIRRRSLDAADVPVLASFEFG
jgi:acyl-coenzyme A synthetase/AMP-(fatty) acid ligase